MHPHLVGDLLHFQRFDEFGPFFDKFGLVIDDGLGDSGHGIPPLFDRFDQPLGGVDFSLDILFRLCGRLAALQQPPIVRADKQAGRSVIVQADGVFPMLVPFHIDIGGHGGDVGVLEHGAGVRVQLFQFFPHLVNLFDGHPRFAGDQGETVMSQIGQVVADERLQFVVRGHAGGELEEEAFPFVTSAHAGGVEFLDDLQRLFGQCHAFGRRIGGQQVDQLTLQASFRVQIVNNPLDQLPQFILQIEPADLVPQVVLQGLRSADHIGHRVVPPGRFLFDPVGRGPAAFLEVARPLFIHVQQPLEVVLVIPRFVDDQFFFGIRRRIRILVLVLFLRQVRIPFVFFQDRVFLNLLLDPLLQSQNRQLQDLHGLDHAWRQHLFLDQSQFLSKA